MLLLGGHCNLSLCILKLKSLSGADLGRGIQGVWSNPLN